MWCRNSILIVTRWRSAAYQFPEKTKNEGRSGNVLENKGANDILPEYVFDFVPENGNFWMTLCRFLANSGRLLVAICKFEPPTAAWGNG